MEFCEETVSTMMENFIKKSSKGNGPSIEDIDTEIDNLTKADISIEKIRQKGRNTKGEILMLDEILMFEQYIADCAEYINRLKELKFVKKLEKSLKDRNQMMKTFAVNNDQSFTIDDDKLYMTTRMPEDYGKSTYKYSLVMTKEVFQECYNMWIKPQEGNIE